MKIKSMLKTLVRKKITPVPIPIIQGKMLLEKKALIVGGSGGIGSAIAKQFALNGCEVLITGTNDNKMRFVQNSIGSACKYEKLDLNHPETFDDFVCKVVHDLERIDILVNSAGIHGYQTFGNVSIEEWNTVMSINLRGTYFMSQVVAKYMIENHIQGHILNVSSASCAKPGWTPYEISKCGIRSLTLGFADKLAKYGITVNSIAPGPVATDMLGKNNTDDLFWAGNPMGRIATPDEIANLAVFMASSAGNMIVGDTFFISGGSGTTCIDK